MSSRAGAQLVLDLVDHHPVWHKPELIPTLVTPDSRTFDHCAPCPQPAPPQGIPGNSRTVVLLINPQTAN